MSERVAYAAILHDGEPVFLPRPKRHHNLIGLLAQTNPTPIKGKQGFVTSSGRFVDREEAAQIAFLARQIDEPRKRLFSEDLW